MKYTEKLNLKKPDQEDFYQVDDFNENADKIDEELSKKATKTQLGRVVVGDNLNVDGEGKITHPTGNGNSHIPINGAAGQFLKWLSAGIAQWTSITWNDITGKPTTFTPTNHTHNEKLDKGAVSSEYDTAKKIEDKIKTAQSTADSKLDKGNVPEKYNTAEKIVNEIDNKLSKFGGTMAGTFGINKNGNSIILSDEDSSARIVMQNDNNNNKYFRILNVKSNKSINMFDNGNTTIDANNLQTESKEIVKAINESLWRILSSIGIDSISYIQANSIKEKGKTYIDSVTKKPYYCFKTTPQTVVTPNDEYFYSVSNSDIFGRLYKSKDELWSGAVLNGGIISFNKNIEKYTYLELGLSQTYPTSGVSILIKILVKDFLNTKINDYCIFDGYGFAVIGVKKTENSFEIIKQHNFINDGSDNNKILKMWGVY